MPVRILPEHVVRRIRAGEVVERPASAIKELVENALDAGARTIRIQVEGGGRARIWVEDDGCGMDHDDLRLSMERHATSKIGEDFDLHALNTRGFRGEALAALSAVADVTISTRARDSDCGWSMTSGPSGTTEPCPCAARAGSTLVVADRLFGAHPARLAFLKSARIEMSHVRTAVEDAALSSPATTFFLEADGRPVLSLRQSSWEERVKAVMGDEFASNSVSFSEGAPGMSVRGMMGLPSWKGHASGAQRLLVNGRPVGDKILSAAIRSAFSDMSGTSRPAGILDLRIDPAAVDVNCHPSKAEVRFRDAGGVSAFVRNSVRNTLAGGAPQASAAMSQAAARAAVPLVIGETGDRRRLPLGRALGIVLGGYAVCECADGVVLVDLHAAAERAAYEKLLAQALGSGIPGRALSLPLVIDVGHLAVAAVEAREDDFSKMGMRMHALDDTCISVMEIPDFVPDASAVELAGEVASALAADPHALPLEDLLSRTCASMACHAAFRFGDDIEPERLDALLREFEQTPRMSTCMHGRPIFATIARDQMRGLFGRT